MNHDQAEELRKVRAQNARGERPPSIGGSGSSQLAGAGVFTLAVGVIGFIAREVFGVDIDLDR